MQDLIYTGIFTFAAVLLVVGILLPFFVVGIFTRTGAIEYQVTKGNAMLAELTKEQEKANVLTRQLIRAYGHEPQA